MSDYWKTVADTHSSDTPEQKNSDTGEVDMDAQELRNLILETIRNGLTVEVGVDREGWDDHYTVRTTLLLDGETISQSYDSLPSPRVSY